MTQHAESLIRNHDNFDYGVHLGPLSNEDGEYVNFTKMSIDFHKQCNCFKWGRRALKKYVQVNRIRKEVEHVWIVAKECPWDKLEAKGHTNHVCRVNRQLLGLSPSKLPFQNFDYRKVELPTITLDTLHKNEIQRHIDFLKIDIDQAWDNWMNGLKEMVDFQRFSIATIEYDVQDYSHNFFVMYSVIDKYAKYFLSKGYSMLLKVPCEYHGKATTKGTNHYYFKTGFIPVNSAVPNKLNKDRAQTPQDVVVYDTRQPKLREALMEGNRECGYNFTI